MLFALKVVLSGVIIAAVSSLAGKKPFLAGFIVALPFVSILSILWSYWEYRDMGKINQFAVSILTAIPLSLLFFLPFVLNRWLKMGFPLTFTLGILCVAAAYFIHHLIFKG